ncbi:hypothetical protein Mal4_00370 [Maioricimonas rarisocia]|uniref:Uncharacterized protein n=1 Tax=Maioricimonas rarisocia TaxID=2528026 RepID=A0A517YZW1_9PLAN|nr:hypothetical protein [Maioricimonas rarisocia]QDU35755.1 hypothetical protein Mal4_00370 [Maioricimonas rarisocia]
MPAPACLLVAAATLLAAHLSAAPPVDADPVDSDTGRRTLVIGNRDEPTETQLLILAKSFCVEMRRHHNEGTSRKFRRQYFDPRYLAEHGLKPDELPVEMAAVGPIFNLQVADDRHTIVCHVGTGENQREVLVLRVTEHEGSVYLQPLRPPHAQTGRITPWILRMKLQ